MAKKVNDWLKGILQVMGNIYANQVHKQIKVMKKKAIPKAFILQSL